MDPQDVAVTEVQPRDHEQTTARLDSIEPVENRLLEHDPRLGRPLPTLLRGSIEIVDGLAPQEGDVIVEGKRGLDTSATTNLDFTLRARGITTIALGGFLTNCCVESTMRTGYEKGYEVITLSDCVAATSPEEHENAIRFDYPMFSDVMTSDTFTGELRGAPAAAD